MSNKTILKTPSGLNITENTYIVRKIDSSIKRLSKASPSDVQEIVASQLELMSVYHNIVLEQARKSFIWALISAVIGLLFFIFSVSFILYQQQQAANISLISGGLIEVISMVQFYLYGKTSKQLADFQDKLDTTQGFLLANSICEGLDEENKQNMRSNIIKNIIERK